MTGAGASRAARGHLAMLAFSGIVAGSFALGALIANDIAPVALSALRFLLAALLVAVLARAQGPIPPAAFRAPWRHLVLGGVFSAYFVLMFEGLKTADPVATAAVFTLTPLMSAGFARLLLGQRMSARVAAALAIGAAGALWVVFRGDPAAMIALDLGRGEAIFFGGCVAHALYTPLVARLHRGEGALVFPVGTFVGGALVMGILGAPQIAATPWLALGTGVWWVILYLSVMASALALVLLQSASLLLPAARVMAYTYLVPVWVILWQIGLGGAVPATRVLPGVVLTACALLLLLRADPRAR